MSEQYTLPRVEILRGAGVAHGRVLLNGVELRGVSYVGLRFGAGDTPVVTLDIDPGDLVIDVEALLELTLNTATLSAAQKSAIVDALRVAIGVEP